MWKPLLNRLENLLPQTCLLCGQVKGQKLCHECEHSLPRLDNHPWRCNQCSLPLASEASHCLRQPPAFSCCVIPYEYSHPVDFLIHQFKYRQQLASGQALATLLATHCQTAAQPDLLVPVPMHWRKRWQRGFNQTERLAAPLARALKLPLAHALRRHIHSHSQKGLGRSERQRNLSHAFALNPRYAALIQNAHVALVDDVVTTTATARCLSKLLMDAGAARVDIWALARTPES